MVPQDIVLIIITGQPGNIKYPVPVFVQKNRTGREAPVLSLAVYDPPEII